MINSSTPGWTEYRKWLEARIAEAHLALEQSGLPLEASEAFRGEIRAYRNIIEAADPSSVKPEVAPAPGYFG